MKQCVTNEVLNGTLCFRIFKKRYLTFLSQIWPFCQNVIVQEVVTFISEWQVYYGSMTNSNYLYFWRSILSSWISFEKEQTSHKKSFFGRQRNRLCDDCFLIWSFQLWATFGWTTQSSTSSDKNGWIHFVFLQLIFGLLSNVDR